ncbi:MAG: hypothetical protein OXF88_08090 [Rhodobacteraceae bacterium]|nr:hypothetical protein [Paracoccaceae bacterium]
MTGGERTSLDGLNAVTPLADPGTVVESGAGGAGAGVLDGNEESPNDPGRVGLVLLRSPEVAKGPAGTMVTGYSLL